jgi:hypothetical protein
VTEIVIIETGKDMIDMIEMIETIDLIVMIEIVKEIETEIIKDKKGVDVVQDPTQNQNHHLKALTIEDKTEKTDKKNKEEDVQKAEFVDWISIGLCPF